MVHADSVDAHTGMANGAVSVNVQGGTPPYRYRWNTGDSSLIVQMLGAGSYVVVVTDSNDCQKQILRK